jgi:hypothetical protein
VTVRRLLGAALMVSVLLGGLVVVTAGPAVACSCAIVRSEAERVARSDAVFVGTMVSQVERIDQKARELMRSSDPAVRLRVYSSDSSRVVWTFQVSRVYKGVVGERQEIVTSMEPPAWAGIFNSCSALKFQAPGPFLVFAYKPSPGLSSRYPLDPGQYMSGSCSGSRPLAAGSEPALGGPVAREPSGPASSPSPTRGGPPAGAPGGPDSWPSPASSPSPTRGGPPAGAPSGSDSSPSPTSLVVGVGVLAVGVAAGLGLAILRARRRASAD